MIEMKLQPRKHTKIDKIPDNGLKWKQLPGIIWLNTQKIIFIREKIKKIQDSELHYLISVLIPCNVHLLILKKGKYYLLTDVNIKPIYIILKIRQIIKQAIPFSYVPVFRK